MQNYVKLLPYKIIMHDAFRILHFYSPMDLRISFRAAFMGSLSGR